MEAPLFPHHSSSVRAHQVLVDEVEDTLHVGSLSLTVRGSIRNLRVTLSTESDRELGHWDISGYNTRSERLNHGSWRVQVDTLRGHAHFVFRCRPLAKESVFGKKVVVTYDMGLINNLPTLRIVEPKQERRYFFARRDWR